ncbi:hypothetical protein [Nostoc sp. C052]|nr:hypothetical protein [Nostoc sp. C052]
MNYCRDGDSSRLLSEPEWIGLLALQLIARRDMGLMMYDIFPK